MKLLKGLAVLALVMAFAVPAYAETQSIKLSGDLAVRYIGRDDYDFNSYDNDTADTDGSYFMTNAEVQLDADLTDNVGVTVRLVNQHDWNVSAISGEGNTIHNDVDPNNVVGAGAIDGVQDNYGEFDVLVDLAYVTLKEFFFTPLTVKIGKQDIYFGKGFIIGANYEDPNGQISADEFTSFTSFKAIRATWDMEPWTIDGVFAMIEENEVQADDDEQLYGVNIGCDLSEYKNAEVELYYWYLRDDEIPDFVRGQERNSIHTWGTRGSYDPHEDITMWGEVAIQRGEYLHDAAQGEARKREAWACDLGMESRLWQEQYAWRPVLGAEYIFYSGQNGHESGIGSDFHGWNRMFRGKVDSAIHEWYNVFYTNGMSTTDRADTNLHQFIVMGSIEPMDNLSIDGRFVHFRAHENAVNYGTAGIAHLSAGQDEKHIGDELDIELTYDYTEDVTFGLLTAWFWSGEYYAVPEEVDNNQSIAAGMDILHDKDVASEIVASCKVAF